MKDTEKKIKWNYILELFNFFYRTGQQNFFILNKVERSGGTAFSSHFSSPFFVARLRMANKLYENGLKIMVYS